MQSCAIAIENPHAAPRRPSPLGDGRWRIDSPAKLNLILRVFPPRADGFHPLESWFAPLGWHDTLIIEPDRPAEIVVHGLSEGVPTDLAANLVGKAMRKLAELAGRPPRGRVTIHKVIPPGGGLGGGSGNAAAALLAFNNLWNANLSADALHRLGAELGSDVPFFLRGQSAICRGRGEIVTPLAFAHPLYAALILPGIAVSTQDVYAAFDARPAPDRADVDFAELAMLPADDLNAVLFNDLEGPAFAVAPRLASVREQARGVAGRRIHMTGSGSTLFTLCASAPAAAEMAEKLRGGLADCVCIPARICGEFGGR